MKKIYIFLCAVITLSGSLTVSAQSFTRPLDTARLTYSGSGVQTVSDKITIPGATDVTVKWNVVSCNFPADWLSNAAPGICDANLCYQFAGASGLYPAMTLESCTYTHGAIGDYHFQINLSPTSGTPATTTGTYYATVKLYNAANTSDSVYTTFAVSWGATGVPSVGKSGEDVLLYPNPANNEINLVYDATADVKTIAVYNIIGKVMAVYRVQGNSANLNLENVPAGIYFARLVNSQGEVVVTRKFTKQ